MEREKVTLIFETSMSAGGHQIEYVHHLHALAKGITDRKFVFVLPSSAKTIDEEFSWENANNIVFDFLPDSIAEIEQLSPLKKAHRRTLLLKQYINRYHADRVFLISFMEYMPFCAFLLPRNVKVEGVIYSIYLYRWKKAQLLLCCADVVKYLLMVHSKGIGRVFILNDSASALYLNKLYNTSKFQYLPDPVFVNHSDISSLRISLNIPQEKFLLAQCGTISSRKGAIEALKGLGQLSQKTADRIAVLFAGRIADENKTAFYEALNEVPVNIQVVVIDSFVSYQYLCSIIHSADALLLPYTETHRSSGLLGYAAHFRKPVIAPSTGLIGRIVRKYKMGILMTDVAPTSIANAISRMVDADLTIGSKYEETHAAQDFAATILNWQESTSSTTTCGKDVCCIFNIGAHYRFPIFTKMADELGCVFYFGDKLESPVKTFDYSQLHGFKGFVRNRFFHHFYWQSGSVGLLFSPYKYYILDGEPYCLSSWAIILLARLCGKKTIAWTHGWYGRESTAKKWLKKMFFSLHSKLMVYSNYAIDLMTKEGISPKKMYCIANSMDSYEEKRIRETLLSSDIYVRHFHNDAPVIIYCGRIQKRKKLETLIDCVKQLQAEGCHVNVVLVGKDVDGVNLAGYANSQGLGQQIWMYGPCYDDRVLGELFYNAHVCVSPGNVGLTAIHSLSFGCPVITHGDFPHQMPEFEAISPGVTGDFFERDNTNDLKDKLKKWISISPQKREQARLEAFKEVDRKWNIDYQIGIIRKVIADFNDNA